MIGFLCFGSGMLGICMGLSPFAGPVLGPLAECIQHYEKGCFGPDMPLPFQCHVCNSRYQWRTFVACHTKMDTTLIRKSHARSLLDNIPRMGLDTPLWTWTHARHPAPKYCEHGLGLPSLELFTCSRVLACCIQKPTLLATQFCACLSTSPRLSLPSNNNVGKVVSIR